MKTPAPATSNTRNGREFLLLTLVATAISLIIIGLLGVVYFQTRELPYLILAGLALTVPVAHWLSWYLVTRRDQPAVGLWLIALSLMIVVVLPPLWVANHWIIGTLLTFIIPIEAGLTGQPRRIPLFSVLGLLSAAAMLAMDLWLAPASRLDPLSHAPVGFWMVAGLLGLFLVILAPLFWRTQLRHLRLNLGTQLAVVFIAISSLSIIVVMLVVLAQSSNAQIQQVGTNFQSLAEISAERVGNTLEQQITALQLLGRQSGVLATISGANRRYGDSAGTAELRLTLRQQDSDWQKLDIANGAVTQYFNNPAGSEVQNFVRNTPEHSRVIITDNQGALVGASPDKKPARYFYGEDAWWQAAFNTGQGGIYLGQLIIDPETHLATIFIAVPVASARSDQVVGVVAATYRLERIQNNFTAQAALANATDLDLLTPNRLIIASADAMPGLQEQTWLPPDIFTQPTADWLRAPDHTNRPAIIAQSPLKTTDGVAYLPFRATAASGEREPATLEPLTRLSWRIVVHQAESEALASVPRTVQLTAFFGLIIMAFVVMAATATANFISRPINALTATATAIAGGDLEQRAIPLGPTEFVTLAEAFNALTAQLRMLINSLQVQVARRTAQLQASAEVGRAASSVLDPDELVRETVNLITSRFGFYYAAAFLVDESGQQALLKEATGEAGKVLKLQGHKLAVGGQSMVGTAIATRKARIALDVGQEAVRFANPLLPYTRSEIALPLIASGQALGALDVQSTDSGAFDENSAAVLQGMADQLAVAIQNARLFQETNRSLRESNALEKFSRVLSSAQDYESILDALTEHLLPAGVSEAAILTFDYGPRSAKTGMLRLRNVKQMTIVAHRQLRSGARALTGTVIPGAQLPFLNTIPLDLPFAISDINAGPYMDDVSRSTYGGFGVRALLGLPLTVAGQLQGLIQVTHAEPRQFESRDIRLLQTAADQIAITLANIQLLNQTTEALRESSRLYEITSGLARAADVPDMLRVVVQHALPVAGEFASLFSYEIVAGQVRDIYMLGSLGVHGHLLPARRFSPEEAPSVQALASEAAPIVIEDLTTDTRLDPLTRETYLRENVRSIVVIRLITGGQLSGSLQVGSRQPAQYSDEELRLLRSAADQIALTLENRNLLEVTRRRATLQSAANEIFTAIRAAATREGALQIAATSLGQLLEVARAFVWLQTEAGDLTLAHAYTRPGALALGFRLAPLPDALEAARSRDLVTTETATDRRLLTMAELQVTAFAAVPLLVRNELVGVFGLHECGQERRWTSDELNLIQDTATQLATSLENIRLVEQLQTSLAEVEDLNRLFTRQGWDEYRQARRTPLLREVFAATSASEADAPASGTSIALPLSVRGESIGEIVVSLPQNQAALTDDERVLTEAIADQVALSLDNARLIEQTQQRVSELGVINQISQALTSRLDLRQQLQQVGESLIRVYGVPNGYIALYDPRTNLIEIPFFAEGAERTAIEPFPLGEGVSSAIIRSRQPLMINYDAERRLTELGAKLVGQPARSFLGVPIIVGDEVIGVVNVQSTEQEGLFNDADLALLTTVAANIGAAIQNARLFAETQRRAEQLATAAEVSRTSNAVLNPDDLVRQTVELIRERFNLYYAAIFLVDEGRRWAELKHATGEAGRILLERHHRLEVGGQSMVGAAISQRQARVALDVGTEAVRFANPLLPDTRSEMAVPLTVGNLVLGALDVQSTLPSAFSEVDVAVLQTMADQVATSLQNARLFAATQRSAQQLAAAAEVGRAATGTLDLDTLLSTSLDLIRTHFGLYYAGVLIVERASSFATLRAAVGPAAPQMLAERLQLLIGSSSLIGVATAARQAKIVADVTRDPNYLNHPLLPDTRSEAVLPLLSGDTVIGALDLQSAHVNAFGPGDVAILNTIADQLAVAVQNARLFEKTARQARREKQVGEITGKIRAAGDMDTMLKVAVSELRQALGVSHGVVRLGGPPASDSERRSNGGNGHGQE